MSKKQQKLLTRVVRDLCAYFGIYYMSQEVDKLFQLQEDGIELAHTSLKFQAAVVLTEIALIMQVCIIRSKRTRILQAQINAGMIDEETANASYFSITGITTLFNALTQTTATVCANG